MSAIKLHAAYEHFKKRYNETHRSSDENALFFNLVLLTQVVLEDHYEKWRCFYNLCFLTNDGQDEK